MNNEGHRILSLLGEKHGKGPKLTVSSEKSRPYNIPEGILNVSETMASDGYARIVTSLLLVPTAINLKSRENAVTF